MLNGLVSSSFVSRIGWTAIFLAGFAMFALGLLILKEPDAAPFLIIMATMAAIGFFLFDRPVTSLCLAIALALIPGNLRADPIMTLVTNGGLAIALAAWTRCLLEQGAPVRLNTTALLTIIYIFWAVVTMLWADDLTESRRDLTIWIIGLLLLIMISHEMNSLLAIDRLMRTLAWCGWAFVFSGLYVVLFTDFDFKHRLKVFGINENLFGFMLIFTTIGVLWIFLRATGRRRVVLMTLGMAFILCSLVLMALTGSRGGALSLLPLLIALLFTKATRRWGILALVAILGALAFAPFLLDVLTQRVEDPSSPPLGGRPVLWEASLLLIGDYPWTGVGIGNGPFGLHRYIASLTSATNNRLDLPSHQPLLEVAVATGLFGLLIYLCIIVSAIWRFVQAAKDTRVREIMPIGFFPLMTGVSVTFFTTWIKAGGLSNHPTFFVLLALLLIPSQLLNETVDPDLKRKNSHTGAADALR